MIAEAAAAAEAAVVVGAAEEEASVIEATALTASIHVTEEEAEVATVGETGDYKHLNKPREDNHF